MGGLNRRIVLLVLITVLPEFCFGAECPDAVSRLSPSPHKRAFTLTEVLVTMTVIGVLVSLTVTGLSKARQSARDVKCLSNLHQAHMTTLAYEGDYKVLPVHWINNDPTNPQAGVDLRRALEIDAGTVKAWQCPEDKGFPNPTNGEILFHSYLYRGLEAMASQRPPVAFYPPNAQKRYERDASKHLYWRLPLYNDVYGFHQSREGPPYYQDGKRNAAWWDGTVQRIPERPPGPPPLP